MELFTLNPPQFNSALEATDGAHSVLQVSMCLKPTVSQLRSLVHLWPELS